jgi:hypothetical protein
VVADLGKYLGCRLQQAPARFFLGTRLVTKDTLSGFQQQTAGFFFCAHVSSNNPTRAIKIIQSFD